jgi:hypothetical protein
MHKAYVESLATGEIIEVLDTRSQTGYIAAREAARRDGAPSRIRWHYGKGINQARVDAGQPVHDWYDWAGKRYVLVSDNHAGVAMSEVNYSEALDHITAGPAGAEESPSSPTSKLFGASIFRADVRRGSPVRVRAWRPIQSAARRSRTPRKTG